MEDLDKKWIWNEGESCNYNDKEFSKRLGLKNLEGIFILVAAGIVSGIPLIVIELIYHRCKNHLSERKRKGGSEQTRNNNSSSEIGEITEGHECCDHEVMFNMRHVKGTVLS